ncbi:MAG TPA: YrzE family protein [Polyangium sp.]|nr:YrzE family protein [Polyangium sp.]
MSSPSQPPPSSKNGRDRTANALQQPRITEIASAAQPHPMSPTFAVGFNVAPTAESAFMQQLDPTNIRAAIEANTKIQLEDLRIKGQKQDRLDAELKRKHERKMKLLELRGNKESGVRSQVFWFGNICTIALILLLCFLIYKDQYAYAIGLISHLAALIAGYFAGKRHSQKKSESSTDTND